MHSNIKQSVFFVLSIRLLFIDTYTIESEEKKKLKKKTNAFHLRTG